MFAGAAVEAVTDAEDEANKKRFEESGGGVGDADQWWAQMLQPDCVSSPQASRDAGHVPELGWPTAALQAVDVELG